MSDRTCSQCGLEAFEGELCASCAASAFALAAVGGRRRRARRPADESEPRGDERPSVTPEQLPPRAA